MPKHRAKKQVAVEGVTLTEVAQTFAKSRDTVKAQLVALKPIGKRGKENLYSLPAVKGIMERIRSKADGPASKDKEELEKRKLELQCDKLQIEIDERMRRLIPVAEVSQQFLSHANAVRSHLLRQPGEVAALLEGLTPAKIETVLTKHNEGILSKLRETEYE